MVASNTLELPYYKATGGQRGRGFGAPSQIIGITAIPSLRKFIFAAAKRVGADLLEFAVPEVADVVGGKFFFKTAARSVGTQTLRKQLGCGKQKRTFQSKIRSETVGHPQTFYWYCKLKLTNLKNIRYQIFVAVSGNAGVKVPVVNDVLSSHEQEIDPTTSHNGNSIEFEFQPDRNVYLPLRQIYLALKTKLLKGRGFSTYKTTGKKKGHKENTVFTETSDDDVDL